MPKPTNERWRVHPSRSKGSHPVKLRHDHFTESSIDATFTPLLPDREERDDSRPIAELHIELDDRDRPQVLSAVILAADNAPLTPTSIRLPLRAMAKAAVSCLSYRLEGDVIHLVAVPGDVFVMDRGKITPEHLAPERVTELERALAPRARNAITDADLRRTAEIVASVPYRDRRAAVAKEFHGSLATAKARIRMTRKAGLIIEETKREEIDDAG